MPRSDSALRAVTFDATGTLIALARPVGETYAEVARNFGAALDPDAIEIALRKAFPEMPPLAFPGAPANRIPRLERDWWRELVGRVVAGAGGVEPFAPFFDDLYEHYGRGGAWRVYPEVPEALESVRARGYHSAVVSNSDSRLANVLRALELDHYFDAVIYSSTSGAAKPDAAIFTLAVSRLGVRPEEVLHAGDDPRNDVEGARAAGLHGVLVDRGRPSGDTRDGVIATLGELDTCLGAP